MRFYHNYGKWGFFKNMKLQGKENFQSFLQFKIITIYNLIRKI